MPYLTRDESLFVLHLGERGQSDTQNVMGPGQIETINGLLDEVLAHDGPTGLITVGAGKYFSTGLDTAWVLAHVDQVDAYTQSVQELLARILVLPMPTVAAIDGHAFGAGALIAFAHDHMVMRADRGYLCMPGVTIGASYKPGTVRLVMDRLPARANHEVLTTGRRFGGTEAHQRGIVDEAVAGDEVLSAAIAYARAHQHTRGRTLGEIKSSMYAETIVGLHTPVSGVGDQAAFTGG